MKQSNIKTGIIFDRQSSALWTHTVPCSEAILRLSRCTRTVMIEFSYLIIAHRVTTVVGNGTPLYFQSAVYCSSLAPFPDHNATTRPLYTIYLILLLLFNFFFRNTVVVTYIALSDDSEVRTSFYCNSHWNRVKCRQRVTALPLRFDRFDISILANLPHRGRHSVTLIRCRVNLLF